MICKWCGETIANTLDRCPKCGRETPAMSDCGGFYNLKTGTDNGGAAPQASGPVKLPQLDKLGHMYVRDMKKTRLLQLVGLGIMAIAVLLLIVTLISVATVNAKLKMEQPDHEEQGQHQQETDDGQDDEKEETDGDNPFHTETEDPQSSLSEQNIAFSMKVFYGADKKGYVQTGMDLGACEQVAAAWGHTKYLSGAHSSQAIFDLGADVGMLNVEANDSFTEDGLTVSLSWGVKGAYFSKLKAAECTWESLAEDGSWHEIMSRTIEGDSNVCQLNMTREECARRAGGKDSTELRCTLTFKHPDGGEMTVRLEGILFNGDGIALNGNAPFESGTVTENQGTGTSVVE